MKDDDFVCIGLGPFFRLIFRFLGAFGGEIGVTQILREEKTEKRNELLFMESIVTHQLIGEDASLDHQ